MYEDIHIAEDMLNAYAEGNDVEIDLYVGMLRRMVGNLKRQRESHLGNETL